MKKVLVLGAGVSGLSSAILLLKKGYDVHIISKEVSPNTTSDKAGAFWCPFMCEPKDKVIQWSSATYQYLEHHVLSDMASGTSKKSFRQYFDDPEEDPWWKDAVDSFRRLDKGQLPSGYNDGYEIESILMDTSVYMPWLINIFKDLGGTQEQREITSIESISRDYAAIVNCTGLGSHKLFNDQEVYPIRGQVLRVKLLNYEDMIEGDDIGHNSLGYMIARNNDFILGGTAQINNWNLEVDPIDTEDILRKVKSINPLFDNPEIVEVKVGLRPARFAVRLESEYIGDHFVVHNYGHGGAGYTLSWGCAQNVVTIVEQGK